MQKNRVLRILSIVLLVSLFLVPIVFAMYRSVTNGNGAISTASWQVSINQLNENDYLSIIPGENGTTASYAVNITSNSEVDAIYSFVINNLPDGVRVSADNGNTFIPSSNNKVIIPDAGTILYSDTDKTVRHVLIFKADTDTTLVNNQAIDISVIARQAL
ncbi:MAG: hypothetical protein VZS44_06295 [Bacilli bacterium]|nr:hypothetical protein [Bacilli bacterium]